jgi:hypothetical protein
MGLPASLKKQGYVQLHLCAAASGPGPPCAAPRGQKQVRLSTNACGKELLRVAPVRAGRGKAVQGQKVQRSSCPEGRHLTAAGAGSSCLWSRRHS